jgi:anti-sigma factor RsiW
MVNIAKVWKRIVGQSCSNSENLSAYVDGELSIDQRRKIEACLADDAAYREYVEDLHGLRQAFQSLPSEAIGFDLAPLVQRRLAQSKPENKAWLAVRRTGLAWPVSLAAACSIFMGIFLGSVLVNGLDSPAALPGSPALAMFDAMPPGGLCVGMGSCYPRKVEL